MIKKISIFLGFSLALIGCFLFFSQGEDVFHNQKMKLAPETPVEKIKVIPILDALNKKNQQIHSLLCNDVKVIAQMPGKRAARLNGYVAYEKDKKFRLEFDSFFGTELDIGSSSDRFWFWSKRMKDSGLYWAKYEDFHKTKLKTPFNPYWLARCMGIDTIDYQDATIDSSGEIWRILKPSKNAKGESITGVIYVDSKKLLIIGHGVYDSKGILVASSEIQSFSNMLPYKISFIWHQENASMVWYLNNMEKNVNINQSLWIMPNKTPKIDMSVN